MPELNDPVEGPPAYQTIADGLPSTRVAKDTPSELKLFLDLINGSDSNDGLTAGQAVATIAAVEERIPVVVSKPVTVRVISPGTYPMVYMRPRLLGAPIFYYADDSFDPSVFTTVLSGTAGVGTTASSIVGSFTANTHDDKYIQMLTGAAAGLRRSIRTVTTSEIIPAMEFIPAPSAGDSYKVFTNAVKWAASGLSSAGQYRRWIDGGGGSPSFTRGVDMPARYFAGIDFDGSGFSQPLVSGTAFVTYGCTFSNIFIVTFADSASWYSGMDGDSLTGGISADAPRQILGLPSEFTWSGWGSQFTNNSVPIVDDFRILGHGVFSVRSPFLWERGSLIWRGGQFRISSAGAVSFRRAVIEMGAPRSTSPVPRIVQTGSGIGLNLQNGVRAYLGATNRGLEVTASTGIGIRLLNASAVILNNVTGKGGSSSVHARLGSVVELNGLPVYGDAAATDWDVGNGTPVNKSAFSSVGATISDFGTNREGSVISRTS